MAGTAATVASARLRLGCGLQLCGASGKNRGRAQPDRRQHEHAHTAALDAGGFDTGLGRVGTRPLGCEETELAIRLTASRPGSVVMYVPEAAVDHHVGAERLNLGYFLRRCWHEGLSKALVVRLAGSSTGLARERRHVAAVIPAAFVRDLRRAVTGNPDGFMRMCALLGGLASAVAGYLTGRARFATHGEARRPVLPAGSTPSPDPAVTARRD